MASRRSGTGHPVPVIPHDRPTATSRGASARPAPGPLLTIGDAAAALGVSTKTVRRLVGRGELGVLRVGRQLRVDPAELAGFLRRARA